AEDVRTQQAFATAGGQLTFKMFGLRLVLVAYIDDALLRAHDQAGQDHALDHQMRRMIEDEAVLDGPRFAFVGIAHDVLRRAGGPAHDLPLHPRREARAAEAPEVAGLERPQQVARVPALHERPYGFVPTAAGVRVDAQTNRRLRGVLVSDRSSAGDRRDDVAQPLGCQLGQDHVVDDAGGSPVAAPEAGDVLDRSAGQHGCPRFRRAHERTGSTQMTRHVAADFHLDHGRRRETEVRIERRHALDVVERHVETLRQVRECFGRQVAVLTLDRGEAFDDHACGYQRARSLGRRPSVKETRLSVGSRRPSRPLFRLKRAAAAIALLAAHCGVASADALQGPPPAEQPTGEAGPSSVRPVPTQTNPDFVPIPDRWRLGFPDWNRYDRPLKDAPYQPGRAWDP